VRKCKKEEVIDLPPLPLRDHDDETSVFDAVGKLNEVKGMRGLGR